MNNGEISIAVVKRLPRYYRYLGELLKNKIERISSKELSERMGITASQIRQDLNNFGGFGQQGYGYNVEYLYGEIGKILGLDSPNNIVVMGAGHLGQAIANYSDFERRGFKINALFDVNPEMIGKVINDIPVLDAKDLGEFLKTHKIDIGAITVPQSVAPMVAAELVNNGVPAIWNFAPTDLQLPAGVCLENVHLTESLMRLSYKLHEHDQK